MANMQLRGSVRAGASLQGEVVSPEKVQVGGGTSNHAALVNRDLPDQHPIEAITGLREELDDKQPKGEYLAAEDVPEWAMSEEKPSYTAEEVNALPNTTKIPAALADLNEDANHRVVTDEQIESWNNKPDEIPVKSVNGKTGDVKLNAEDVGALPAGTAIPDELGDLKGDASHRTVTDAQISAWNAKSDFSGEYSDLKNIPEAPVTSVNGKTGAVKLSIPDSLSDLAADSTHRTVTDTEKATWNGKLNASDLGGAVDDALAQAKASGEFNGADGERGTGILKITTAPSSYTAATGGFTPTYRVALSTVKTQANVDKVLVGDTVAYNYYQYPVGYVDASYVYLGARTSVRGAAGTTPVKGTDYYTDADKAEMVTQVKAALPTLTVTGIDADGTTHTWTMYGVKN